MEAEARRRRARHGRDPHARAARSAPLGHPPMKRLVLAVLVLGCAATVALAQGGAPRTPLPARVTAKLGMLNVPALSRSEEHTSELQSLAYLVCRLLLEKKKIKSRHELVR